MYTLAALLLLVAATCVMCHLDALDDSTVAGKSDVDGGFERKEEEMRGPKIFYDCKDAYKSGLRQNGIYKILPDINGPPFKVYCDMTTDGGGWTVIQRREDGYVNFYRDWNTYEGGFGDLNKEFFLGLSNIHRLSSNSNSQLRVDLQEWNGNTSYAKYSSFSIGGSDTKYQLSVSGYSGTAGDSLSYHNGMKFSTFDQNNQIVTSQNCAKTYIGAWWYNKCHESNLNGAYIGTERNGGNVDTYADGVVWYHLKNYYYSLKGDTMMIRRKRPGH